MATSPLPRKLSFRQGVLSRLEARFPELTVKSESFTASDALETLIVREALLTDLVTASIGRVCESGEIETLLEEAVSAVINQLAPT